MDSRDLIHDPLLDLFGGLRIVPEPLIGTILLGPVIQYFVDRCVVFWRVVLAIELLVPLHSYPPDLRVWRAGAGRLSKTSSVFSLACAGGKRNSESSTNSELHRINAVINLFIGSLLLCQISPNGCCDYSPLMRGIKKNYPGLKCPRPGTNESTVLAFQQPSRKGYFELPVSGDPMLKSAASREHLIIHDLSICPLLLLPEPLKWQNIM